MSQTYPIRFQGHEEEIRHDMRTMGLGPSCDKWEATYEAWERYSQLLCPGEKIPYLTELSNLLTEPLPRIARVLWSSFFEYLETFETENARLREKIAQYEMKEKQETDEIKMKFGQLITKMRETKRDRGTGGPARNDNKLRQILSACRG